MLKAPAAGLPILLMIVAVAGCATSAGNARLAVVERDASYDLTVPVSRVVMMIPRAGLVRVDVRHENPRYFYFQDKSAGMILSGWFEAAERYPGLQQLWSKDTAAWRTKGLPEPRNVRLTRIARWEAITYDMPVPAGTNSHLRAQRLQAGTWIDVHLSLTSTQSNAANQLMLGKALTAIQVKEKASEGGPPKTEKQ
jgi:hypothetical protein